MIPYDHIRYYDKCQLFLQWSCLDFLWAFGETHQDRKFLMSKRVLPLVVDALLLPPAVFEETGLNDLARRVVAVNQKALGPFGE